MCVCVFKIKYGSNRQRFPPCQHQYLSQFLRTSNKILQPSGKKYLWRAYKILLNNFKFEILPLYVYVSSTGSCWKCIDIYIFSYICANGYVWSPLKYRYAVLIVSHKYLNYLQRDVHDFNEINLSIEVNIFLSHSQHNFSILYVPITFLKMLYWPPSQGWSSIIISIIHFRRYLYIIFKYW